VGPGNRAIAGPALALWLVGCSGGTAQPDARPRPDAIPGEATAALGRCLVSGSGAECTGVPGESGTFAALADGDEVTLVVGPQGALMLVLAVRTIGMDPGDPDSPGSPENPEIDLRLYHAGGGEEVGRYRGRPSFTSDEEGGTVTAVGLFVVLELGSELEGRPLDATVEIVDRQGEFRWGGVLLIPTR
jgi:hypothetical protein